MTLDTLELLKGIMFKNMAKSLLTRAESHPENGTAKKEVGLLVVTRNLPKLENGWN